MENYFHYFSEIEEHFQRRRGTALLLSTLDWALIETWKESGIPLQAVLRGIDTAFDHYDSRPRKTRKINSLAYCAQAVMTAAEDLQEAALGTSNSRPQDEALQPQAIALFLETNAEDLRAAGEKMPALANAVVKQTERGLREMAESLRSGDPKLMKLEQVERRLTVLEEKLFAALLAASPEAELLEVRTQAGAEMAPYRRKMPAAQIEQLHRQYIHKRLFERYRLPRLSLFYMRP